MITEIESFRFRENFPPKIYTAKRQIGTAPADLLFRSSKLAWRTVGTIADARLQLCSL